MPDEEHRRRLRHPDYSCTVNIFSVKVNKLVKQADAVAAQGGVGDL